MDLVKKKYFVFAIVVFIADQLAKYLIISQFKLHEAIKVVPFLNIVYVRNTGTAFGMFQRVGNWIFILFSIVAIVFIVFLMLKGKNDLFSFALFLGGALGNLYDRIFRGYVVDFIDVHWEKHHWPAFNIADSALTIGIMLLIAATFFHKKER